MLTPTYQPTEIESVLDRLEETHARLSRGDADQSVVDEAGHLAVHVARRATKVVHRELYGVDSIAPQIKGREVIGMTKDRARVYLRLKLERSFAAQPSEDQAIRAVANLIRALKQPSREFRIALLAEEVAIILLGPKRLGGVYAQWQASDLGVGLLTWIEQQSLNLRVLGRANELDKSLAKRDAEKFELPPLEYLQMGCHGNIAKACFRAVVENECRGFSAEEVLAIGSENLIASKAAALLHPEYSNHVLTMAAMEAAVQEHLGHRRSFWTQLPAEKVRAILEEVRDREPSEELRQTVFESARRSGMNLGTEEGQSPGSAVRIAT